MRRLALAVLLAGCALCAIARAAAPLKLADGNQRPRLKSIYSNTHELSEFVLQDTRGLVLVFLGTECPVARRYLPRLMELHREFQKQGVQFVGIYSDARVNVFRMAQHAHDEDIAFPVMQDVGHRLADMLDVQTTPEVVVLDPQLTKKYQGAIDDQFARHGSRPAATEHYLRDALTAIVKGEAPPRAYAPPSGCPLERTAPARSKPAGTYYKDVAPIVQQHCQGCHRPGGVGPFELLTFDDVAYNTAKIREVIEDRRMPPWHGVLNPEFGQLAYDERLSADEIETVLAWIDGGAAEGNRADAPPPRRFPAAGEWAIGKPDFVYRIPQPFQVPKTGQLDYQFFRVRMGLNEDRWFRAVEVRPGNPEVVHHISLHIAPSTSDKTYSRLAAMTQLYGLNGELARVINDFVPGDNYNAKIYPPDQAVLIPKNSDLIFEVHYTPNGRAAATDQSMVAFQWAEAPPQHEVLTMVFRVPIGGFRIPPRDPHFRAEDTYYFKHDVEIDAIRPHYHWRGKSFRLEIIDRDPETDEIIKRRTVLSVPIFDQGWQRTYELKTPLRLPAGTELLATGHFDNSRINPNNPDPNVEVTWGQQTSDEMFSTRFKYRRVPPSDSSPPSPMR